MDAFFAYRPQGLQLSCSLDDIPIYCQEAKTVVSVHDEAGATIFSETLWADRGGVVRFCELGDLLERHMRTMGYAFCRFRLSTPSDTMELPVLHCSGMPLDEEPERWLRGNFLTSLAVRRVAPGASLPLSVWAEEGEPLALDYAATVQDGEGMVETVRFRTDDKAVARRTDVAAMSVSVPDIAARVAAAGRLLAFTVTCGRRSLTCAVCPDLEGMDTFFFRNEFHVWDWFCLPSVTVATTEAECGLGVVGGTAVAYDRKLSRTYETQTGPLSAGEAAWIHSLPCSPQVVRLHRGRLLPVIVTDTACEVSDSPDEPASVSFTWRYAACRMPVGMETPPGVFTSQFTTPFA